MVNLHGVIFAKTTATQSFLVLYVNSWFAILTAPISFPRETALDECASDVPILNLMLIMMLQTCQNTGTVARYRESW